jgi:hypothetical protein
MTVDNSTNSKNVNTTSHLNATQITTCAEGNRDHGLGQAQKCGGVRE